jgi:hypothetical protein
MQVDASDDLMQLTDDLRTVDLSVVDQAASDRT